MSEEADEFNRSLDAFLAEIHHEANGKKSEVFPASVLDQEGRELCAARVHLLPDSPDGLFYPTSAFLAEDTEKRATHIQRLQETHAPIPIHRVLKCPASGELHFHFRVHS